MDRSSGRLYPGRLGDVESKLRSSTMNAFRCRIQVLLIVVGLVVPMMPVAGDSCRGDSCTLQMGPAVESHSDGGSGMDSCCTSDEGGHQDDSDRHGDSDGCCPIGCNCVCCDTAVVPQVRSTPPSASIAPRSVPAAIHRLVFSPQDAVNRLLRPPQV